MDGIEKMVQRITDDAQKETDAILAQARADAQETAGRYAAQAEKLRAELEERGQAAAAEREERLEGLARMEGKKVLLGAKQGLIGDAFALAVDQLSALPREEYLRLLVELAMKAVTTGREELAFSPADRAEVGEQVTQAVNQKLTQAGREGSVTLSEHTYPIRGGLFLRDEDGDTDCSLETLVRLSRNQLTPAVSALLFD